MKKTGLIITAVFLVTACTYKNPSITITVDTSTKYQYVRGFGAMDVGWGNFPLTTPEDIELMFDPESGLGLNILRIMIMPHNTDIDLTMEQVVSRARPHYYENVKIVNNYGGYVLASPWSPPKEWKNNNNTKGDGKLLPEFYKDYANYLKAFARNMYENGAPIYAISIQNEPDYKVDYDGCLWTGEEMRDFFKLTGRFTEGVPGFGGGKEMPFVLTMNGEAYSHPNINNAALDDPESRKVIDIIGRHTYGGRQVRYINALDHPTDPKEVWMTEHNINSGKESLYAFDSTWNFVWKLLNDIDLSIRLNDENTFIWWAGKRFYSFIGDGQYNTAAGKIMPRGYAISHYARFANETWRVAVDVQNTSANEENMSNRKVINNSSFNIDSTAAKATAFVSPDRNTISLVFFNPTAITGEGGVDMGTIKIQLPEDFEIREAAAMRSKEGKYAQWEKVKITGKNTALVNLPRGNILSVRFTQ
ncbi:MAG: hypothetical protein LBU88_05995 [Treponema sp.]|jgi:O-glycosyl hydrolase|nr:hypothetical protein [Treponema sp.]